MTPTGLAWSSGAWWKEQRTFALTTLRKFGFGKRCLQSQVIEEVDCLMDEFEKYEGKPFNIHYQLKISVSNVICSLLFGKRFEYEDAKFQHLMRLLNTLLTVVNFSSPAFIFPSLSRFSIFSFTKANPTIKALAEFVGERAEEHRETFDENNIKDYIDAYLLEQKQRTTEVNTTFTGKVVILYRILLSLIPYIIILISNFSFMCYILNQIKRIFTIMASRLMTKLWLIGPAEMYLKMYYK